MRVIATNSVAWSVCLSVDVFVCLLGTTVSHAKMAGPIEMLFVGTDSRVPKEPYTILDRVHMVATWRI